MLVKSVPWPPLEADAGDALPDESWGSEEWGDTGIIGRHPPGKEGDQGKRPQIGAERVCGPRPVGDPGRTGHREVTVGPGGS